MPHTVTIPAMGESITEGIVAKLLVAEGAAVGVETPIFELETDKVSTEVIAGAAGTVHFTAKEGDKLPIGATVAEITLGAAPAAPTAKSAAPAAAAPAAARNPTLSPAVAKLVADKGIDPAAIAGTGKSGLLTKGDVLAHLAKVPAAPPATGAPAPAEPSRRTPDGATAVPTTPLVVADSAPTRKRMSTLRQRIAQRLVQAQHTAAILSTFNEIDMQACMALRKKWKDDFEKQHGIGLGFMSFFTAAVVQALQKYPLLNSQIEGEEIVTWPGAHIGIAVGTERGLVVPVLRDAQRLSFAGIERAIRGYAAKAREGKLAIDDMQGGTFTITNGGVYGSLLSTPIINPPQSGILGMHAIKDRPVAVDGQVVIRPMMYVALSYDHRIIDGAQAVGFLVRIKELIEAPERMVLGL